MNPPRPEDFGISADAIQAIKAEQEQLAKRSERAGCLVFLVIYGIAVAALWPTLGPISFIVGIGPTFIAGLITGACLERLHSWFIPANTRRRLESYNAYLQAQEDYDDWFVRTQTTFWRSLDGLAFEREVASLLTKSGLPARLTPASNDKGIDLILGDGSIVQCKQRKDPVGPAVVRELYGTLMASRAPRAILISTNGFTPGAHDFAKGKPIELWDHNVLIKMQRDLER